jgi:cellulose biosynthesis protein BcsQ
MKRWIEDRLAGDRVKAAVGLLSDLRNPEAIMKTCEEIDRVESDADRVMRSALSRLFREESDVKQLIKLRSIYELLELITDRGQYLCFFPKPALVYDPRSRGAESYIKLAKEIMSRAPSQQESKAEMAVAQGEG